MAHVRLPFAGAAALAVLTPASLAFAVPCYVDSQGGSNNNSGLSEAEPFQSQASLGSNSSCTEARFKRGSTFNEALQLQRNVTVYTNYGAATDPLPRFVVPRTPSSGPVVQGIMQGGVTIDGLYLAGATGDGTMNGLMGGICVMLGANSHLLNNEITDCDIGIMISGEGSEVRGNYVHDLIMGVDAAPGVDPNSVGGAEGIFINASNNEVSYNTFVNCKGDAEWVGSNGGCDGGATEVTVGAGETLSNVRVHHNFSYNNCGFLEIATGFGDSKGLFADSQFYDNVTIDSGWMGLLQVNNTDFSNVRFYNNTLVQRANSTNAGLIWIIFTDTSSGMTGGELVPGTVSLTNNLFVLDGVSSFGDLIDPAFTQTTNLVVNTSQQDPGFVNINGTSAADFDLLGTSPAIDVGTAVSGNTLDFLDRPVPANGATDVGAFEFQPDGIGGAPGSGGTGAGTGGATEPTCASGLTLCGDACVDLTSDPANCGGCGTECPEGQLCSASACATACTGGLTQCGQSCVDLMSSLVHCGGCDAPCLTGQECVNGNCEGTPTGGPVTQPVAPDANAESDSSGDSGGCGCIVAGGSQRGALVGAGLLGLLASLIVRRRRSRRV